jgi:hypothetical protein
MSYFSSIGGRTVQICIVCTVRTTRGRGHRNRGKFGMFFEVVLSVFLAVGSYRSVCTVECGHTFQGVVFWAGRTTVRTWHIFEE